MTCPCGSQHPYRECCEPYHDGIVAENALILMRSRYSAYAMHRADYIMDTTHPLNPSFDPDRTKWKNEILSFCKTTHFDRLEILSYYHHDESAEVTFIAHLTQNHKDASFTEQSRFEQLNGCWLYRNGKILNTKN